MNATCFPRSVAAQCNKAPRPPSVRMQNVIDEVNTRRAAMSSALLREKFASLGAPLQVRELRGGDRRAPRVVASVRQTPRGRYVDLGCNARRPAILRVEDVRPDARELTLVVDDAPEVPPGARCGAERFLCRFEQRRWHLEAMPVTLPQATGVKVRPH